MSQLTKELLAKTVSECLYGHGRQSKFNKPFLVGLEIEAEGKNLPDMVDGTPWKLVNEGSLRGGYEYVLRSPTPVDKVHVALKQWEEIVALKKSEFYDSLRTSTHIHLNVLPLSFHDLIKVVVASWIVESALVHLNGPNRVGNLFCLRLQDAEYLGDQFVHDIDDFFVTHGGQFFQHAGDNHNRYAALNIAAVKKFGSLEYRFMKGMYTREELWKWIEALHHLASKAVEFPTVTAIADAAISMPPSLFLRALLPEVFAYTILDEVGGRLREYLDANQHVIRRICEELYRPRFIRPVVSSDEDIKFTPFTRASAMLKKNPYVLHHNPIDELQWTGPTATTMPGWGTQPNPVPTNPMPQPTPAGPLTQEQLLENLWFNTNNPPPIIPQAEIFGVITTDDNGDL